MKYYTNYFENSDSDKVREVEVLTYDQNKYCHVRFIIFGEYHHEDIKTGYIFTLDKNMKRKPIKKNYLIKLPINKDDSAPTRKEIAKTKKEILKDKKYLNQGKFYLTARDANKKHISTDVFRHRNSLMKAFARQINDKSIYYTTIEKDIKAIAIYCSKFKTIITKRRTNLKKICKNNGLLHIRPTF